MKVAVLGAGAIGAYVGACLTRGGTETHLIARGAHLDAMRDRGVSVISSRGNFTTSVSATDDPAEIGPVDIVFLGLKAYSYAQSGDLLRPLLAEGTSVVAAQNGIPWWYFHGAGDPYEGRRIQSVDPGGAVSAVIPWERAIGCVVYAATEIVEPGVIRHLEGTRFAIGETNGTITDRCRAFSAAMVAGGLKCPVESDLRSHIWLKLMGNATLNPLSAITRASLAEICAFSLTRRVVVRAMEEVVAVAKALGSPPQVSIERRLRGAERVGHHHTSMLQDLDAGKPLELEVLLGAAIELGDLVGIETPTLAALYGATALLDSVRRDAPPAPSA
jgi:2-dehydropantoate 2-reductase